MFQIACNKVNKSLAKRGLVPVFDLHVNHASDQEQTHDDMDLPARSEGRHRDLHHLEQYMPQPEEV